MVSSISGYGSGYGVGSATSMLRNVFSKTDANGDSALSKDELLSALDGTSAASDKTSLSSAVDDLIGSLDSDGNGSLNGTEFDSLAGRFDYGAGSTLLAAQEQAGFQQRAQSLYSNLDGDGSGGISQDELSTAVSSALSASRWGGDWNSTDASSLSSDLFASLDSDEDGSVSQDELTSALKDAEENRPPPPGGPGGGPPPAAGVAATGIAAAGIANDTGSTADSGSDSSGFSSGGTTASSASGSSAGGSGADGVGGSSTSYDPLDTNQDGYVSAEERMAGSSGGSASTMKAGVTSNRLSADTLRTLIGGFNEIAA